MILSSLADLANLLGSMNWYASAILASLLRPAPPQPGPFHSWSGEGIPGASEYSSRTEDLFAPLEWENISDHLWEISYKSCENLYTAYILGFSLQARYLPVVGCYFAIVKRRSDAEQSSAFAFRNRPCWFVLPNKMLGPYHSPGRLPKAFSFLGTVFSQFDSS
jgi:hypothetical protein